MNMTLIRDAQGRPLFYLDAGVLRDENGKLVGERASDDARDLSLADVGAAWLRGAKPTSLRKAQDVPATLRDASDDRARKVTMTDTHAAVGAGGERKVLLDLSPTDVVTPATQAEFGIPDDVDFVADRVSAMYFVRHDRGVWYPENVTDATKAVITTVAGDGTPPEVNPSWSPQKFTTTPYGLAAKIPRLVGANADFDLSLRVLRFLTFALRLQRELRVAKLVTTAANWSSPVAAATKWNASTGANPLLDLYAARASSALPSTAIVLPENVEPYFFWNSGSTAVRDFVQAGGKLPEVICARARSTVSGSLAYVWAPTTPANVALIRTSDDPFTIPTSATLRWIGKGEDGQLRDGVLVRHFRDRREDADWIVVVHNDAEVLVSNTGSGATVGGLITGALA